MTHHLYSCTFFFFNDTATTEIYTLSLHDALPIFAHPYSLSGLLQFDENYNAVPDMAESFSVNANGDVYTFKIRREDRKSTRLNSSHANISYAVFCLKKKKKQQNLLTRIINHIMNN